MREIMNVLIFCLLLICSMTDLHAKTISTYILGGMSLLAILCFILERQGGWISFSIGLGIGILFLFLSWLTKEAIGFGDSWLICNLGVYLGGALLLEVLMVAMFCSGFYSLIGIAWRHWNRRKTIPFVPFLMIAYVGVVMI